MKIGFFGGCFNPPTIAHIALANKVLIETNLDKVIFVPVGDFYKKKELTSAKERYNMLKLVCDDLKNIEVSDIELDIKETLYAIDAFKLIEEKYRNDEIYFIMGADNFINLTKWKAGKELIEKYKYIVLERDNIDIEEYVTNNLKEYKNKIKIVKNEEYGDFSSSMFRENNDFSIVPNNVLKYIKENNLYKIS